MEANIREALRRFARQENAAGFVCSVLVWIRKDGLPDAMRKARAHLGRKHAQKRYVRRLLHPDAAELERQRGMTFAGEHRVSILVPLYNTPETFLREMLESVTGQTCGRWELCLADGSDDGHPEVGRICRELAEKDPRVRYRKLTRNGGISENTNACMEMATGDYIALFDHDDLLMPSAVYEVMRTIEAEEPDFIYTDEMVFASPDREKVIGLHFKPDYAPDTLLSSNYICHLTVFRAALLERTGGFRKEYDGSQDHDLILRLTDAADSIIHIPKVLYLWRSHEASVAGNIASKTYAVDAGRRAVQDHLAGKGIAAEVENSPVYPTLYRIRYPIEGTPLVTLIAETPAEEPARGNWIRALRAATDWQALEIAEESADDGRGISARLNAMAGQAGGEYLLFVQPGLMPEDPEWIRELIMLARRPDTGCAGGMIVTADGLIREAGAVAGLGRREHAAGRSHSHYPIVEGVEGAGYLGHLAVCMNMSAVTGACMMVRKSLFQDTGGFDEKLRNALYDADLCLRLRKKGLLIVHTPFARMKDGTKRRWMPELGSERNGYPADAARFREKWLEMLAEGDPYYNLNLTRDWYDCRVGG